MNRRDFLHLFAATAAAAVAGLRPRPEPTGMTHELMTHELLSSAHPDIVLDDESLITWPWVRVIADWREG